MKFSFKFSNLLGTVYRKGNLVFSADGNSVYSPVGNKITAYDLKNNKAQTLQFSSQYNYESFDLSPNGLLMACVDERGEACIISTMSKTIICKYRFYGNVPVIKFSPNGQFLVALKDSSVFVFKVPGSFLATYKSFELLKMYNYSYDKTTSLDWASNSSILIIGSADATIRLFAIQNLPNFTSYCLASHRNSIIASFFENDSLDVISLSCDGVLCLWECNMDLENLDQQPSVPKKKKLLRDDEYSEDDIGNSNCEINLLDNEKNLVTELTPFNEDLKSLFDWSVEREVI